MEGQRPLIGASCVGVNALICSPSPCARVSHTLSSPSSSELTMFRLRVLGQVDLRDPNGREVTAVLVQPKRLALLAYLVAFRPQRMHRRDALLPLFWPDIPESRARSSL